MVLPVRTRTKTSVTIYKIYNTCSVLRYVTNRPIFSVLLKKSFDFKHYLIISDNKLGLDVPSSDLDLA